MSEQPHNVEAPHTPVASRPHLVGALEAGGTKFRAATYACDASGLTRQSEIRIETAEPDQTLGQVVNFFVAGPAIAALGIASFGPLILDPASPAYGSIAPTPKPHWSGVPLLDRLRSAIGVPATIQTDVEAAAAAELAHGAGQGHESIAYVTVGTGIGVGIVSRGEVFRGRDHVELGHMPVRRASGDDFAGVCPFHGDCLEGLASGPAIHARWHARPSDLDERSDVWNLEAGYLAQLVRVLTYSFAPDKVLFGGGVGARSHLAPRIADATKRELGGYSVSHPEGFDLVATAGLGQNAGLVGAAMLAQSLF